MLQEGGLKAFAGGNLGEPLSRLALNPEGYDVAVVELSSYQLESIVDAQFDVACWLNLMPDHLERYESVDAYAAAKRRLLERRRIGGVAVLNAKDSVCADAGIRLGGATRWFSRLPKSDLAGPRGACGQEDGSIIRTVKDETEVYRPTSAALIGLHGLENAAAAIECARHLDVSPEAVQRGLQSFQGLAHRLECVSEAGGVTWYNDSKATNPAAVRTALDAMSGPVVLILGGKDKGAPWDDVLAAEVELRKVLLVGAAADLLAPMFLDAERVGTIDAAVVRAAELAEAGDAVLLSPGCASYDQFNNFEERGDAFKKAVLALSESEEST
ncbi:unnamed protein product [Chondrus crispus]|uniref:Uncharacterized protein n=1 Tax=Chondrus crispus TaxID=2769 RepID=R7Q434_CHOCR|nr:unnamed protein product [Chondrus crispus]CDF32628.1 unnamed protein product [Chondrus crispus]|eukprot:XP_005712399.1 unnamed protein product [Chondrus crispus]